MSTTSTPSRRQLLNEEQRAQFATIYLVRHGETEWNTKDILQGHLDSALTERGLKQARDLVNEFRDVEFDAIFSSDVARAHRTAEVVALEKKLAVTTTQLLRERNWGRYDGVEAKRYREECRDLIEKYNKLSQAERWSFKFFEDIESFEEIFVRFMAFLREAAVAYRGRKLLVVSHLDVLGALLQHLGCSPKGIDNMAWIKLLSDGTDLALEETRRIKF